MADSYPERGKEQLRLLDNSDKFTEWMYSEIKDYLRGNILEVGSGIGTYTKKVIRDFPESKIIASDIDSEQLQILNKEFGKLPHVSIVPLNISKNSDIKNIKPKVDTVFCLNVLEHVEDDVSAIKNAYKILNPGGLFIILVPAYKFLFNKLDMGDGHFRRYSKQEITEKASKTNFKIVDMFYFNSISLLGWYLAGSILKKDTLKAGSLNLLDSIVPLLKIVEKYLLRKSIGISLISVLKKE